MCVRKVGKVVLPRTSFLFVCVCICMYTGVPHNSEPTYQHVMAMAYVVTESYHSSFLAAATRVAH
jgi:hypothetical protein